jgi:hypothetical protein
MDWITNLLVALWRLYIKLSAKRYPVPMQTLLNPSNKGDWEGTGVRSTTVDTVGSSKQAVDEIA